MRASVLAVLTLLCAHVSAQTPTPLSIDLEVFSSGWDEPVGLYHAGDDRVFILEQDERTIEIIDASGNGIGTFLDVSALASTGSERGLLGLAFHPDYANNGFFYINYTDLSGNTAVVRYEVSSNPNLADASSGELIIGINQDFGNHNGGHIAFGPDGYLYIGMGDGGDAGDPFNRAQDGQSLLGKMLRLDVDNGLPYSIPADNPFVGDPTVLDEIWSLGLRNPWKFDFDDATGDMWIGDVGQNILEEIDFEPANSGGGFNYGWRCYEGNNTFNTGGCSGIGDYTFPVADYSHVSGYFMCSITGGEVYRGSEFPFMQGHYIFTDYCAGSMLSLKADGMGGYDELLVNSELGFGSVAFGSNANGDLFMCHLNGNIYKLNDSCGSFSPTVSNNGSGGIESTSGDMYYWYQDGTLIPSENDQTFSPTMSGSYYAVVENSEGCARPSNSIDWVVLSGIGGCTYTDATNYDTEATVDNGTCVFDCAEVSCASDLNGDLIINAADLLIFLGAFGNLCD